MDTTEQKSGQPKTLSLQARQKIIKQILEDNKITGYELLRGVYRRQETDSSDFTAHKLFIFCAVSDEKEFHVRKGNLVALAPKFRHGDIFTIAKKQERALLIADEHCAVFGRGNVIYKQFFDTLEKVKLNPATLL